jgi:tetratricopeptide (TPR) repeat protein
MRILTILLFLFFPLHSWANNWEYKLEDAINQKVDEYGNKNHSVDMRVIDYYLEIISNHAKEYPPKFKSKEEQQEIVTKLEQLIELLEIIGENKHDSPEFLARAAFANSMGHNVNLKGSAEKSGSYYKKLLKITPENPVANYQYGMFLSGTKKYHFDSIPYLEKALELKQYDARYTLGLLYYQQGKKEKGMKMLQKFASDNPSNSYVKKIIDALKSGKLKFESS